jgi:hypothetical protein
MPPLSGSEDVVGTCEMSVTFLQSTECNIPEDKSSWFVILFVQEPQGKKKSKYVNLYSADGQARDVILLKGQ